MARGSVTRQVSATTGRVSWRARTSYRDDAGTRWHRSRSFATRKEAEAWLTRTGHELHTGVYVEPSTIPLAELARLWLRQAQGRLRSSTLGRYQQSMDLYIAPALGSMPVARIRPSHVQALFDDMTARGLSAYTVGGVHTVLNGIFKAALHDGLIPTNPCTGRRLPKPERSIRYWTTAQLRTFLDYTEKRPTGPLWAFLAYTGVRIGEAMALSWDDIDFARRLAHIHKTARRDGHGVVTIEDGAKTATSNRTISLPAMAVLALRRQAAATEKTRIRRGPVWEEHNLVFPSSIGTVLPPGNLNMIFRNYVEATGLPYLTPHGLRHTAASMMYRLGVSDKVIQEQLGHKSVAITMDLYTHLDERQRRSAADAIDADPELTRPDVDDVVAPDAG